MLFFLLTPNLFSKQIRGLALPHPILIWGSFICVPKALLQGSLHLHHPSIYFIAIFCIFWFLLLSFFPWCSPFAHPSKASVPQG